ncbi:MAG: hypothetical protein AB1656_11585 [Candidatus Omnitrophota bacterium]
MEINPNPIEKNPESDPIDSALGKTQELASSQGANPGDRFNDDQIVTLVNIHECLRRIFSHSLSAFLRMRIDVCLKSYAQVSYKELLHSFPSPTYLALLNPDPLEGKWIMEFSTDFCFAAVDRLCGGRGDGLNTYRELSDAEQTVIEKILYRLFDCLHEAFANIAPLTLSIEESATQSHTIGSSYLEEEMVFVMTLSANIRNTAGTIRLCYPYSSFVSVENALSSGWKDQDQSLGAFSRIPAVDEVEYQRMRNILLPAYTPKGQSESRLRDLAWRKDDSLGLLLTLQDGEVIQCIGIDYRSYLDEAAGQMQKSESLSKLFENA